MKKILQHRAVSAISLLSIGLAVGGALWAYFTLESAGDAGQLILHFNDIAGITSAGGVGTILFMGVIGLVITLMNFAIALELESRDRFLGKLTAAITLIFAVLLFIAFAAIINVNV